MTSRAPPDFLIARSVAAAGGHSVTSAPVCAGTKVVPEMEFHVSEPLFVADPVLWDPQKPMCHVAKAGDFLWLSGIVAYDDERRLVGLNDIQAQSRQIFTIMQRRLALFGCDLRSIIRLTTYMAADMKDMTNVRLYWDVRQEFFGDHRPASTGVQVAALMTPDILVEVDAVAYAPDAVAGAGAQILPR